MDRCEHVDDAEIELTGEVDVCEDCVKSGDRWVHLNVCKTCGYVGCCDSSVNQHARRHHEETGHAIISRAKDGSWLWCYEHGDYVKPDGSIGR